MSRRIRKTKPSVSQYQVVSYPYSSTVLIVTAATSTSTVVLVLYFVVLWNSVGTILILILIGYLGKYFINMNSTSNFTSRPITVVVCVEVRALYRPGLRFFRFFFSF